MTYDITTSDLPEQATAVVSGHVEHTGIGDFLDKALTSVLDTLSAQSVPIVGPPFARYGATDSGGWQIEAGFPVNSPIPGKNGVVPSHLPGGLVAQLVHVGAYDTVAQGWAALSAWVGEQGYVATETPWECYLDAPDVPEPRTLIVMPCRPLAGP